MKRNILVLAVAGTLTVTVVGAQNEKSAGQRDMAQGSMQMMQACPIKVEGTTVAVEDTSTGIAVTFTAKPANVAELQARVQRMSVMHNAMSSSTGNQQHMMIAGTVKYEAIPAGARLTLAPKEASKLKEFREQVRSRVEQMKKGDCSMMQEMMMQNMQHMMGGGEKQDVLPH